jgi:CheY-like chemotaxis protein
MQTAKTDDIQNSRLLAIANIVGELNTSASFDSKLQQVCEHISVAFGIPGHVSVCIYYDSARYTCDNFIESPRQERFAFSSPDKVSGVIELHWPAEEKSFAYTGNIQHVNDFLGQVARLIIGSTSAEKLAKLIYDNSERIKELTGIQRTAEILKKDLPFEQMLQEVCLVIPEAWQYPESTVVRLVFGKNVFFSRNFQETPWMQKQVFETPDHQPGSIEVFYLKEFPVSYEGPFLKEERNLINNLAALIAGSATREILNNLRYENKERLKELHLINQTSAIISLGKPTDETLQKICSLLPRSYQYPRYTAVKILYEGKIYRSRKFTETAWVQREHFISIDNKKGTIEVYYLKEFPKLHEGPFMKEERDLIINLARLISGYLNNYKGREIYTKGKLEDVRPFNANDYRQSLSKNKRPLQLFFNRQSLEKYIFLDMMRYKVKEVLFVATLYDAFILENEDSFFERFMGIIYQYSLFSLPRITGVTNQEEALELLESAHFDMVILMVGIDRETPVTLSENIKKKQPGLPIYLLLNQKSNIRYFEELVPTLKSINKLFVWSGNSQIFFALVKSVEDEANVENDTRIGLVRVILLIEDSALYYSKYLQMLYSIVFGQVQQVLPEVEKNELNKIAKMRSRPKILLARNYEDAMYIFNKYKDFMLCVISDVEFDREGKPDKNAGIRFIKYIKSHILNLPILLQSSEKSNESVARSLNVGFINKNSDTLLNDLKNFLTYYLGFGDFVFRNSEGEPIGIAKSLREFEALLQIIPDETFYLHAVENQFSLWLMARGEIELARTLNPLRIGDYKDVKESRRFFLETIRKYREEKKRGKVLGFDETATLDEKNIVAFASGSFGGKGRGLAFINAMVYNFDFGDLTRHINIRTPITIIIGTEEFENFMESNKLFDIIFNPGIDYKEIRRYFVHGGISTALVKKLQVFVEQVNKPIAVRSSSLSEDSLTQPFAGVFDTYIIPNNPDNKKKVLFNLIMAIKLVFASVYSDNSKRYFHAIHHKVEDEKMAVILQELVGNQYGNYYYPHLSGIAQSHNFYPVAHMKPEEGFAVAALGLGSYVVDGWKSYRFSPRYPKIEMYILKDLINSSQVKFYALDTSLSEVDYVNDGELASLVMLDISEAERHGSLKHCASVYNMDNDRLEPGLGTYGPRIVNFADILQFNYIPLAETIDIMLGTIEDALGSPVEIEFAVDLDKTLNNLPSFYLLQIKPLVGNQLNYNFNPDKLDKSKIFLFTTSSLGNGEMDHIRDVIYVDSEKFNKLKTFDIAEEIETINNKMISQNRQYILIGPGRWGSRDPFLGIPVNWSQISQARVIVEISLANYPLDSSLGSHFFHNVTSMNIGYFSVSDTVGNSFIRWDMIENKEMKTNFRYLKHVRFDNPLQVLMNGKLRTAVILNKQ